MTKLTNAAGSWSHPAAALVVAGALILLFLAGSEGPAARVDRIRVDPSRAPRAWLESLEGMGGETALRIVRARGGALAMRSPADLAMVPGVGTKLLHRWHEDLDFPKERR